MIARVLDILVRYQLILVGGALVIGLTYPTSFLGLNTWNGLFLQVIMFATGLKLNVNEFLHEAQDWRTLFLASVMMLVGLPFLVSIPLSFFAPHWLLPFVLAAAMPTGLTAPAVVTILGGRTSLAVLIATATSFLSPFTIPFTLRFFAHQTVQINILDMMLDIAWVVVFPLLLSTFIQWRVGKKRINRFNTPIRLANLIAFVTVILSIAATSAASVIDGTQKNVFFAFGIDSLIIVILMLVFWFGIAWLTAAMLSWRDVTDRMTVVFCLVYMNITLVIWMADKFFRETGVAPKLIVIFIATTIALPLFKFLIPHHKRKRIGNVHRVEQL